MRGTTAGSTIGPNHPPAIASSLVTTTARSPSVSRQRAVTLSRTPGDASAW